MWAHLWLLLANGEAASGQELSPELRGLVHLPQARGGVLPHTQTDRQARAAPSQQSCPHEQAGCIGRVTHLVEQHGPARPVVADRDTHAQRGRGLEVVPDAVESTGPVGARVPAGRRESWTLPKTKTGSYGLAHGPET